MALFARSDLMSVSIPVTSGGCGATHSRPVTRGAPARIWKLECPPCEGYLRGDGRPKILKTTPGDPKLGIPAQQERVADGNPQWSSTPDTVPLTPDEAKTKHVILERGEQQLRALESLRSLKDAGVDLTDRPDVLYFLRERGIPLDVLTATAGQASCRNGHGNVPSAKFCAECGVSLAEKQEPHWDDLSDNELLARHPDTYETFHVNTLKKLCRQEGLPDKGTKQVLVSRLQAARKRAA